MHTHTIIPLRCPSYSRAMICTRSQFGFPISNHGEGRGSRWLQNRNRGSASSHMRLAILFVMRANAAHEYIKVYLHRLFGWPAGRLARRIKERSHASHATRKGFRARSFIRRSRALLLLCKQGLLNARHVIPLLHQSCERREPCSPPQTFVTLISMNSRAFTTSLLACIRVPVETAQLQPQLALLFSPRLVRNQTNAQTE